MFWPSPQDYNETIQTPVVCFTDPELKNGSPELTSLGLPRVITGAFASVYKLHCANRDVAVRCFLTRVPGIERRYRELSKSLLNAPLALPYFASFEYLPDGMRIGVRSYPVLKMDWVEGTSLTDYLEEIHSNRVELEKLLKTFDKMVLDLQKAGIAHGDLQHGNVLVKDGSLRLVDYDGMYVPSLEGMISNENGHANYQHPQRNERHFGTRLDDFSAWLMHLSLRCLIEDPGLWEQCGAGDECLLLRQSDLRNPAVSTTLALLCEHRASTVQESANFLKLLLAVPPTDVPAFDPQIPPSSLFPQLQSAASLAPPVRDARSTPALRSDLWSVDNMAALGDSTGQIVEDGSSAFHRGTMLQNGKQHERAIAAFTLCKSRADDDELYLTAFEASVVSFFFMGRIEDAAREYLHAQHFRRMNCADRVRRKTDLEDQARQAYLVATGLTLLHDSYYSQSCERFLEALEYSGKISHSYIGCQLGIAYLMEGKFALARARFEIAAMQIDSEEEKALTCRLGNLLMDMNALSHADLCFKRALTIDPEYIEAHLSSAKLAIKDSNTIEALKHMRTSRVLIEEAPRLTRPILLSRIGLMLVELNLFFDATKHFHEALALDNRCAQAQLGLARINEKQEHYEQAREHVSKALRYDPFSAEAHIAAAELLNLQGQPTEASIHFKEAVKLKPVFSEPYLKAGNFFLKRNLPATAIEIFTEALSRGLYSGSILFRRGLAFAKQQEHDQALKCFDQCLELDRTHFAAHFNRGIVCSRLNRKMEALAALDLALTLHPTHPRVLEQRASVLIDLQRFAEAIDNCNSLLQIDRNNEAAMALRGLSNFGLQRYLEAAADLRQVIESREDDPNICHAYVVSLGELGHNESVLGLTSIWLSELQKKKTQLRPLLSNGRLVKVELLFERGKAFSRMSRYAEALADFNVSDLFHDLRIIRERALVHKALGNFGLAAEDFASLAMATRPLDAQCAFEAASLYFQSRNNRKYLLESKYQNIKFLDFFDQAVKMQPDLGQLQAAAPCWHAKAEQLLSDPSKEMQILDLYRKALLADEHHYPSLMARGRLLAPTNPLQALNDFNTACQRYPERAETFIEKGKAALALQLFDQAITAFSTVSEHRREPIALYWRCKAYHACGRSGEAMDDLRQLLPALDWQTTECDDSLLSGIRSLALEVCKTDDSLKELIVLLDKCPATADNTPFVLERGLLKLRATQFTESIKDFDIVLRVAEKRRTIYPGDSLLEVFRSAFWGRGQAYLSLKKPNKARKDFTQLLYLDPASRFHGGA